MLSQTKLLLVLAFCAVVIAGKAAAPPPPSNDNSANATTLTHSAGWCSANAAYTTVGATADGTKPSKWSVGPTYNVWFKFQATTTSMSVDIKTASPEGTLKRPKVSLHNSSLTELVSVNDNGANVDVGLSYEGLTVGSWYYLNVDNGDLGSEPGTFRICLSTATSYDYPAGAVTLAHNAGCSSNAAYTTMIGAPNGAKPAAWQLGPNNNVWFKFQATTTSVSVLAKTGDAEGTVRRLAIALHDASMTVLRSAAHNLTYDDVGVSYEGLTIGNWYYVNVDNGDLSHERGTFTICINSQTSSDYPAGATTITHSANWCSPNAAYTTMIGTPNGTKPTQWAEGPGANVWFKFQATTTNVAVDVKTGDAEGTIRRPKVALYNNSITELRSANDYGNYSDIGLSYAGLTIGQWYYIAVDNGALFYERGTFTLCVSSTPTSDVPAGAIELTNFNNWCSADAAYSTLSATPDGSRPSNWYDGPNYNVYFKFTATTPGISVKVKTGDPKGSAKRIRVALLNSSLAELRSNGDQGTNYIDVGVSYNALTVGSLYYIMVDNGGTANGYDRGTFSLCVNSAVDFDYPTGAIELTSLTSWCSPLQAYTTYQATPDGTRPNTWTYGPTNNVWFKFKAQRPNVTVNVKTSSTEGTLKWPNVAIYNASLAHVVSVKDAGQNNDITINNYNGLTIGNWYYIQVDNGTLQGDRGTFSLCIDNGLPVVASFAGSFVQQDNVQLSWTYTGSNHTGFEIERSLDGNTAYEVIYTAAAGDRSYIDSYSDFFGAGQTRYYRIRAINAGGASPFTQEIFASNFADPSQQPVTWTKVGGATNSGSILTKTASGVWGNAGAESENRLADHTNGWVEYVVPALNVGEFAFGFTEISPDNEQYSIGFAFNRTTTGLTYARNLGSMLGQSFNVVQGDILRIERTGTDIIFSKNGTAVYTHPNAPVTTMIVDAALYSVGSTLSLNANFGPLTSYAMEWQTLTGASQTNPTTITKSAASGYGNSGAFSFNELGANSDGYIEITLDALNQEKTFGFSDADTDNNSNSIDYAFNINSNLLFVYENGVSRGGVAGAAVNDILRIWRIGDKIYWLRNGVVVYTKTSGAISGALHADAALNTNGVKVVNARTSTVAPDGQGTVPDQIEFLVLKDLFDNMGGANWTKTNNWPTAGNWPATATSDQFATWQGVVVNDHDITGLVITSGNLINAIPASIGNLKKLGGINFSNSHIVSPIPSTLATIPVFGTLMLDLNDLSGSLPSWLFDTQIGFITVRDNDLTGALPTNFGNATNLNTFDASNNQLSGSIPSSIGSAIKLRELILDNNNLSGSIPPSLWSNTKIQKVSIKDNDLTGSITSDIQNAGPTLWYLYLDNNQLSGSLPSQLNSLTEALNISLSHNNFSGSVPAVTATRLTALNLSYNQLTGSFPALNAQMALLSLEFNQLSGSLPSNIGSLTNLVWLHIQHNAFTGTLPASISTLDKVTEFYAEDNQFSGSIPDEMGDMAVLYKLRLDRNQFTGEIPYPLGSLPNTNLNIVSLSGNQLTGAVPYTFTERTSNFLTLDISNNNITTIPTLNHFIGNNFRTWNFNVSGNRLDFSDIEALFELSQDPPPPAVHRFNSFTYTNQQPLQAEDLIRVPIGGPISILTAESGAHTTTVWEYKPVGSSTWISVNDINQNPYQTSFTIAMTPAEYAGTYRYKQTNEWATGVELVSEEIVVETFVDEGLVPDQVEFLALKAIFDNMGGAEWSIKNNWPLAGNWPASAYSDVFGTWFGIQVQGHDITAIQLQQNNLIGPIPAAITNLTGLYVVRMGYNAITGTIPSTLSNLTQLVEIRLESNSLTGSLPSMTGMDRLQSIGFNSNQLSGTIPPAFWDLPVLFNVDLSSNAFTGTIASNIGNAEGLIYLDLSSNQLTGSIPASIGSTNLVELDLGGNQLTGSIPSTIGNLEFLRDIQLGANQLTGPLPPEIGNLTRLTHLQVGSNQLSGPLPTEIGNLPVLSFVSLGSNNFSGSIPASIGNISTLYFFEISNNQLTGALPASLFDLQNLEYIGLSNNQLTGELPFNIGNAVKLASFQFYNNSISGPIPSSIGRLQRLSFLNATDNDLSGPIPESMSNMSMLGALALGNNALTGPIPSSLGDLVSLGSLILAGNHLEGTLPQSIADLPLLTYLELNGNNLTAVPTSYTNRSALTLNLAGNRLDFTDLEPLYIDEFGQSGFAWLNTNAQQWIEAPDLMHVPAQSTLLIDAVDPGTYGAVRWEYMANGATEWTDISTQNQNATQKKFMRSGFQPSQSGKYRYIQNNSWVPNLELYSEEINIEAVDPLITTFDANRYFNGIAAAMRWRTDAPFATGSEDLDGIYLFKYDNRYQLTETQYARAAVGNTFILQGNKFRVTNLSYDPNGNIKTLNRYNPEGVRIHNFVYDYNEDANAPKNNRLNSIHDYATYEYTASGAVESVDNASGDQFVEYDVTGHVLAVHAGTTIESPVKVQFTYDDLGYRLSKMDLDSRRVTWYLRDGSGNVLNIYETDMDSRATNRTEVPIYGSSRLAVYYPTNADEGIAAYEITDQVGNVRAIVEDRTIIYKATIEDNMQEDVSNPRVTEGYYFRNIWETEVADFRMNKTEPTPGIVDDPERAAYLYWNDNPGTMALQKSIGPAITLRVDAGDVINIEAFARYQEQASYTRNFTTATLASLLGGTFVGLNGVDNANVLSGYLQNGIGSAGFFSPDNDDTRPFAYLNYMVLDENFAYVDAGAMRVDEDGEFSVGEETLGNFDQLSFNPIEIASPGYVYVWVANESKGARVWFDDLKVTYQGAMITQATDYDPWGVVQRNKQTDQYLVHRYGYQGMFSEMDPETGWNHFDLREYDAIIARWLQVDPMGQFASSYVGMGNSPVTAIDPTGGTCFDTNGNKIPCPGGFEEYEKEGNDQRFLDEVIRKWNWQDELGYWGWLVNPVDDFEFYVTALLRTDVAGRFGKGTGKMTVPFGGVQLAYDGDGWDGDFITAKNTYVSYKLPFDVKYKGYGLAAEVRVQETGTIQKGDYALGARTLVGLEGPLVIPRVPIPLGNVKMQLDLANNLRTGKTTFGQRASWESPTLPDISKTTGLKAEVTVGYRMSFKVPEIFK